ncbi:MAG: carboxylating nicotinate-nucleotide diphosphorylase [Acidimicrobiia bacterium]|nr:carboxylating nicotinate-nucleotide diphosphorylase [Acidimicrobiia bacterium]
MTRLLHPPLGDVRAVVERGLAEDLAPFGDLSATLVPDGTRATARFRAREAGVVAGSACVDETFTQVDSSVVLSWELAEGDTVAPGQALATVEGSLESILVAERTALNLLCHLSGIASATAALVQAADGGCRVWDTRKTLPGMRSLQKAAVRAGGGWNHRANLSDWIMLKDNHLMGVGIADGVARARERWPGRTVEVECDRLDQVRQGLEAGADLLLLDNMSPHQVREAIDAVDEHERAGGRRPLVEASGGIDIDTIADYARTGVDLVSVGALTHSVTVLDIGLDIDLET